MMRIALFCAVLLTATALGVVSSAAQETLDCERTIIGCADAGPKPEHPGDRGGYAQLLTLGVLIAGMGFVGYKITSAVRERDAPTPTPDE